jgi:phage baseplate assembly protein W
VADLAHWLGNDLTAAASGDLLTVDEPTLTEQALVRRLLTPPGAYIWHPSYGAGLAQYIGQPSGAKTIEAIVRAQLRLESAVASDPAPQVSVTSYFTGVMVVTIVYWNNNAGAMRTLSFDVNQ